MSESPPPRLAPLPGVKLFWASGVAGILKWFSLAADSLVGVAVLIFGLLRLGVPYESAYSVICIGDLVSKLGVLAVVVLRAESVSPRL